MQAITDIFQKSSIHGDDDVIIETKLREFIDKRLPWLKFENSRKSYATRRFEFTITEPDFIDSKSVKNLGRNLDIVLAAVHCDAFTYRDKMIINVPRDDRDTLYLGDGLEEYLREPQSPIRCYIGERNDGAPAIIDFEEIPHIMVAGTTGSGKSTCLQDIILTIAAKYSPEEALFYIADDKNTLSPYSELPHVVQAAFSRKDINTTMQSVIEALDNRKKLLAGEEICDYNKTNDKKLPHIFVLMDETDTVIKRQSNADNIAANSIRSALEEIAAEGRSLGIHLIIASQKPIGKNIDTTIRDNVPGRVALQVTTAQDSRNILGEKGAEKLSGKGDGIMKLNGVSTRIQCAMTTPEERKNAIEVLKKLYA